MCLLQQKEESVVVVFKNSFASSQGPIILDFFDEAMQKVGSSSCYQLAPNIIQVQFPGKYRYRLIVQYSV